MVYNTDIKLCYASIISHSKNNFRLFSAMGSLRASMAIFAIILLCSSKPYLVDPNIHNHLVFKFLHIFFPFVSTHVANF